jgi:hypothetical protein
MANRRRDFLRLDLGNGHGRWGTSAMRRPGRLALVLAVATFVSILAVIGILTIRRGFSARDEPSSIEKLIARQARAPRTCISPPGKMRIGKATLPS